MLKPLKPDEERSQRLIALVKFLKMEGYRNVSMIKDPEYSDCQWGDTYVRVDLDDPVSVALNHQEAMAYLERATGIPIVITGKKMDVSYDQLIARLIKISEISDFKPCTKAGFSAAELVSEMREDDRKRGKGVPDADT